MSNESNLRSEEVERLVERSQTGDQEAFSELYEIFIDPIYRYVSFRVKNEDAEDIVENIFLRVWEKMGKYEKRKSVAFSAWIFRIAHNMVVDHYRGGDRSLEELPMEIVDESREHNPLLMAQNNLNKEVLKKALGRLKESYREVIVHKFLNDLSNAEVAAILGKSEGSLRILQFRALKALKEELVSLGMKY